MPGSTATYALPFPLSGDTPDGPAQIRDLAEDVEAQLARLDALVAGLSTATDWATYTPGMQNIGSGAFSTASGYWRRTWTKTVFFLAYFVVSTNGTGSLNIGFQLPTNPNRTFRQRFTGVRGDSGELGRYQAVTFAGGTANWIDRIVGDSSTAYLTGVDLDVGQIYTFSGTYREA